MKGFLQGFGVALCGLATSILVAIADVAFARMTGFDFFTFSIWLVVPVGAVATGFAAASGYYFGSLYFHQRPRMGLFVQMVVIAGLTQILIYWLGYETMVLPDGRKVAGLVPFFAYMDVILTKAHYRIGRALQSDTGEIGEMGYWMAVAQFVGFLLGGVSIFFYLKAKLICAACKLYLRPLAKKTKVFADSASAATYFDPLFHLPVDGPEFAGLIRSEAQVAKDVAGAIQVQTSLLGCPQCKDQVIEEKVQGYNGKEWKSIDNLTRRLNIPPGVDLAPVFRG